jgi:SOS response regulatory protein OraA/RecX
VDNEKRLCLEQAVTKAEIYAVKVIEEELNRKGITQNSIERKIIITRTADVLTAHREEVRDMYKKSGLLLQDWIIKMSGIKDLTAFRKMKRLGFTGDVMQDMKKMEEAR